MSSTPNPNRSFFSIAAWYAVGASLAAAALLYVGCILVDFSFGWAAFVSITSAVASIVSLFGIRRHGWRVIVWKSLVGFVLSCLVFLAPGVMFLCALRPIPSGMAESRAAMRVDTQDLTMAAEAVVRSLLESGVLDRAPHHPAMLALGKVVNQTSEHIDMALLTGQICTALMKTGKAVVATPPADALTLPDCKLSGGVFQSHVRTGNIAQNTFVFQFTLADSDGVVFWQGEKEVTKQTTRPSLGL